MLQVSVSRKVPIVGYAGEGGEMEQTQYKENVVDMLAEQMKEAGVGQGKNRTFVVTGRMKRLYSIHTKMRRLGIEFDDVHNVIQFRIIVDDVASC